MITIYGIHNCDTVKKTRKWFDTNEVSYAYHDFRNDGFEPELALRWSESIDHNLLINRRSTTWKQLSEAQKQMLNDSETDGSGIVELIAKLIVEHPTLIKRPVIDTQSEIFIGYNESQLETLK